jgi:hypothetical protein
MAFGFIWKKQLMWFLTLLLVVGFGLALGAMLQERFQENATVDSGKNEPSLTNFPTTPPGTDMEPPSGEPPRRVQ